MQRDQSHYATYLATCASASRKLAARGFQSGHDGTRRNRVRPARTPLPNVPCPGMVCNTTINGAPGAPARPSDELNAPGQERNLVRAKPARRWHPPPPTLEKRLAHARHVGIAPIVWASAPLARFGALAHVSPFHYHHRQPCSCVTQDAVTNDAVAILSARRERQMDRN